MLSILYYIFLVAMCFLFLGLSILVLMLTYPFQKSRRCVHEVSRVLVNTFFVIPPVWRRSVEGLENLDRSKSYVVVCNHQSMIDIPTLYSVPLNFRWVSKREVFKIPFFGRFLMVHGDICINRAKASEAMNQLLGDGKLWISRGVSIAIFPEGTRSRDGNMLRFRTGAFLLAKEAGVEILPVVMSGTASHIKKSALFNWRNKITIKILPPVSVEDLQNRDMKEVVCQVRGDMMRALESIENKKIG